jgi:hypothetical protein
MSTPNGYTEIRAMFGNPANADGTLNRAWEDANIQTVKPPVGWKLYYQDSPSPLVPVTGIRMHKLLAASFTTVMQEIWLHAKQQLPANATNATIQAWLHTNRLDQTAGGFNFRKNTSNPDKLSLHSYGIAIDWDPAHNPRKKPLTKTLPDWWYAIWASHGWSDGKHFLTPDPMHVQFATGA